MTESRKRPIRATATRPNLPMPTFIETQFPIARLSAESYKERKANLGQTLTRLGKWWGRKPLILVRAAILGMLMPRIHRKRAGLFLCRQMSTLTA